MTETQPNIVGVRFSKIGKVYHFEANILRSSSWGFRYCRNQPRLAVRPGCSNGDGSSTAARRELETD